MTSREYWKKREEEALKHYITDEVEYKKHIDGIYDYLLDQIEKEINGFYTKYADAEGITMAEAKKRVSKVDIEAYSRKAEKYVKNKDFSSQANAEMRLYNATMKINRLEMLKANIGLEMVDSFDELQKYFDEILTQRTLDEFERQAGILGESIRDNAKAAHSIVNASFNNATFSDRIWMYQDMLKNELSSLIAEGLIQGRHPNVLARHLQTRFGVQKSYAERLMRTELARVQIEAQKRSYENGGFDQYMFIATHSTRTCPVCAALDGKVFDIKSMVPASNAPPMHPNCRCSTAAYMDRAQVEKWAKRFKSTGISYDDWKDSKAKYIAKSNASDIIKMNLQFFAKIPEEKLTEYALDFSKAPDKARAFKESLGYTKSNYQDLINNIQDNLDEESLVEKGDSGHGMKYEYVMRLKGPNGKEANVLTAWIQEDDDIRLTSTYVTKKKVTK